tara:strand:- start:949 stop:1815 length:867 start_codon:yes stop_codon:yes gene_type:complete
MQFDQSADVAATLATVIDILDASGTNQAGTALTIRAGAGTGTGAGGSIILQTADGGSSGSSVNSHATAVTILDNGNVGIGVATPAAPLSVLSSNGLVSIANGNTANGSKIQSFTTAGNADGYLAFEGHTKEYARLDANGLKFNGDTAAANALDDYEEGTWTPAYSSSSTPTISYGNQIGRYVKVGQIVSASFRINISSISGGSGSVFVAGLPYASETVSSMFSTVCVGYSDGWGTVAPQSGFLTNGGTSLQLLRNNGTDGYSELDSSVSVSHMGGICDLVGHLTYRSA